MSWYKESQEQYDNIPEENKTGDCFTKSYNYMMDKGIMSPNLQLVHAIICPLMGPLAGVRFGHAWVEDGDKVIDTSRNNQIMEKKDYYLIAGLLNFPSQANINPKVNIKEDKIRRYSVEETRNMASQSEHGGPWDDDFDEYVLD